MQEKRLKIITVSSQAMASLVKLYGCRSTIYNALAYRSWNTKAERIRHDAVTLFGGVEGTKTVFI